MYSLSQSRPLIVCLPIFVSINSLSRHAIHFAALSLVKTESSDAELDAHWMREK